MACELIGNISNSTDSNFTDNIDYCTSTGDTSQLLHEYYENTPVLVEPNYVYIMFDYLPKIFVAIYATVALLTIVGLDRPLFVAPIHWTLAIFNFLVIQSKVTELPIFMVT